MDDSVKKWIKKKLDEGISEDRIKKTLKETGRDPGLVDEVQSPFEGTETDTETPSSVKEDERTPSSGKEEDEVEAGVTEGSGEESGFDSLNFVDNDDEDTENIEEEEEEESSGHSFSLPSVSMPSLPSIHVSGSMFLALIIVLLILGLGYTGFSFLESSSLPEVSNPLGVTCTDGVGVKLYNAGVSGEETVAEVYTDQEAEMVLEVFSGESKMGEGTKVIDGRGIIRVDAVGDRAVFHEKGCKEPFSETSY